MEKGLTSATKHRLVCGIMLLVVVICSPSAWATHFRFGYITWKPRLDVAPTAIEFTFVAAFRRDGYTGTALDGFPQPGDTIQETIGSTKLCFDDNNNCTGTLSFKISAFDPGQNWIVGQAVDEGLVHTYPSPGDFVAFTESGDRILKCDAPNAHINNPEGRYRVETKVNVGTGNSSPVSSLLPIAFCPQSGLCRFFIPAADSEGNPLTFRLSTNAESLLDRQPGPPDCPNAATLDPVTGLYTWDTTGCTLAAQCNDPQVINTLYSTQVTIEDGPSKAALDFLIQLASCPESNHAPVFNPPTPVCGSTIAVNLGQLIAFTVAASDQDSKDTVDLNVGGLPFGATMTPTLPIESNPVSSAFAWTPVSAQIGSAVVTFAATDRCGAQTLCSVTLAVAEANADLAVTKTASPDPVTVGQPLTYTVTVTNTGPSTATGVTLTDTLPAGVTFVSASPQGSCNGTSTVTCSLGNLGKGASATVTIVVTPTTAGNICNTASVKSSVADSTTGNNTVSQCTTVTVNADLAVTKTDSPDPVAGGSSLTYTLKVTNNGPSAATGVTVTDTLPAEVIFGSALPSQGSCKGTGPVTCNLGTLDTRKSATVTIEGTVTPVSQTKEIKDTASVTAAEPDLNAGNNAFTETTTVLAGWRRDIPGTANKAFDAAFAVVADQVGDVVAAGYTTNADTKANHDFTVVKFYGTNGNNFWTSNNKTVTNGIVSINGTAKDSDKAFAVAVDADRNVVAAGYTTNINTTPDHPDRDFTVIKLRGDTGEKLWPAADATGRIGIDGTAHDNDEALAVTVVSQSAAAGASRDVIAAGYTTNTGTGRDFTVVGLRGTDGTSIWTSNNETVKNGIASIDGTAHKDDAALAVTVDAHGDVVAAGYTTNINTTPDHPDRDFTVVKFSGTDGAVIWLYRIPRGPNDTGDGAALAVTVDLDGNVVAAGYTTNTDTGRDFTVVKLTPDGKEFWSTPQKVRCDNNAASTFDQALAVTVDQNRDVIAAGVTQDAGTNAASHFTVAKLSGDTGEHTGDKGWCQLVEGAAGAPQPTFGEALAVTMYGEDAIATGVTTNATGALDFTIVRLSGTDGHERARDIVDRRKTTEGKEVTDSQAGLAVTVDPRGSIVAAGWTRSPDDGSTDMSVVSVGGLAEVKTGQ